MGKTEAWKGQSLIQNHLATKQWGLKSDTGYLVWECTRLATILAGSGSRQKRQFCIRSHCPGHPPYRNIIWVCHHCFIEASETPSGLSHQARQLGLCLQTRTEEVNPKFIPHSVLQRVLIIRNFGQIGCFMVSRFSEQSLCELDSSAELHGHRPCA